MCNHITTLMFTMCLLTVQLVNGLLYCLSEEEWQAQGEGLEEGEADSTEGEWW